MAFTETTDGMLFALSAQGEVYRSETDGGLWNLTYSRLEGKASFLTADHQDRLYAATTTFEHFGKLYRSEDGGQGWEEIYDGPAITDLVFNEKGAIWAARGEYGIVLSENEGADWTLLDQAIPPNTYVHDLAIAPNDVIFAAATLNFTYSGIYRSQAGVADWEFIDFNDAMVQEVEVTGSKDQILLVTSSQGLHRSMDMGDNWDLLATFPAYNLVTHPKGQVYVLRWEEFQPVLYFSSKYGEELTKTTFTGWLQALFLRENNNLYVSQQEEGGILRTAEHGQNWIREEQGFSASRVLQLVHDDAGYLYAATRQGLFRSTNQGQSWTHITYGLPERSIVYDLFAHPSGILYAAVESPSGNRLYSSFDGGDTWGSTPLTGKLLSFSLLDEQFAIAQTAKGTFRTFDNWLSMEPINTVARDFTSAEDGRLYALIGDRLSYSTDFGNEWISLPPFSSEPAADGQLHLQQVQPLPDGRLITAVYYSGCVGLCEGKIYRSDAAGQNWTLLLEDVYPTDIVRDDFGRLYANPDRVAVSTDDGDTWTDLNSGLTFADEYGVPGIEPDVSCLILTYDGELFAGTRGFGVFTGTVGVITTQENITIPGTELQLFPNPAITYVQVAFQNNYRGAIRLQLINQQGQVLKEQVLQKGADRLEQRFALPNVPTGQYWIRLVQEGRVTASPLLIR